MYLSVYGLKRPSLEDNFSLTDNTHYNLDSRSHLVRNSNSQATNSPSLHKKTLASWCWYPGPLQEMGETKEILSPLGVNNATDNTNKGANVSGEMDIAPAGPFASFDSYSSYSSSSDESDGSEGILDKGEEIEAKWEPIEVHKISFIDHRDSVIEHDIPVEERKVYVSKNVRKLNSILSQKRCLDRNNSKETGGDSNDNDTAVTPNTSCHRARKRVRFSDGSVPGQPISPPVFTMIDTDLDYFGLSPQLIGSTQPGPEEFLPSTTTALNKLLPDSALKNDASGGNETGNEDRSNSMFNAGGKIDGSDGQNTGIYATELADSNDSDAHIKDGCFKNNDDDDDDEAALNELDRLVAEVEKDNAFAGIQESTEDQGINDEGDIRLAELDDQREQLVQRELEQRVSHLRQRLSNANPGNKRDNGWDHARTGKEIAAALVAELVAELVPGERAEELGIKEGEAIPNWIVLVGND